jgi:hypothetical protein
MPRIPIFTAVTTPKYGSFDGLASRYTEREAWVLNEGRTYWTEINRISHAHAVRRISQTMFDQFFGRVPPLPPQAFRGEVVKWRAEQLLAELTPLELEIVQQALANHPALPLRKAIAMLKTFRL